MVAFLLNLGNGKIKSSCLVGFEAMPNCFYSTVMIKTLTIDISIKEVLSKFFSVINLSALGKQGECNVYHNRSYIQCTFLS